MDTERELVALFSQKSADLQMYDSINEMMSVLSLGTDVTTFDNRGYMMLKDLFNQQHDREVRIRYNEIQRRLERIARSSKLIIYCVIKGELWALFEVAREYPFCHQESKILPKLRGWGLSETCYIGEQQPDTLVRGLWEEWKFPLQKSRLIYRPTDGERHHVHKSSVFPDFWTIESRFWAELMISEAERDQYFSGTNPSIKDGNVWVHHEWRRYRDIT